MHRFLIKLKKKISLIVWVAFCPKIPAEDFVPSLDAVAISGRKLEMFQEMIFTQNFETLLVITLKTKYFSKQSFNLTFRIYANTISGVMLKFYALIFHKI